MGLSENRSGPARSPRSGVRSQEAERENRESTRAASGKRDSAEWRGRRAEETTREHRAESRKYQSSRQLVGREPRATNILYLIYVIFVPHKESILWNSNPFEFFPYHFPFRK